MKKSIFTLLALIAFTGFSFAQSRVEERHEEVQDQIQQEPPIRAEADVETAARTDARNVEQNKMKAAEVKKTQQTAKAKSQAKKKTIKIPRLRISAFLNQA